MNVLYENYIAERVGGISDTNASWANMAQADVAQTDAEN
jgi:hypothetical protein